MRLTDSWIWASKIGEVYAEIQPSNYFLQLPCNNAVLV